MEHNLYKHINTQLYVYDKSMMDKGLAIEIAEATTTTFLVLVCGAQANGQIPDPELRTAEWAPTERLPKTGRAISTHIAFTALSMESKNVFWFCAFFTCTIWKQHETIS